MKYMIYFFLSIVSFIDLRAQDVELKSSNSPATVYILRAYINSGLGPWKDLFIDDRFIGEVRDYKYVKLSLTPGEHLLWSRNANPTYLLMKLEAGKTYVVHANVIIYKWKPHFQLFDFGDFKDMGCEDCYEHGLERLNKFISKGSEFHFSDKYQSKKEKKYRKKIQEALSDYKNNNTTWDIEILDTPIQFE